VTGQLARSSQLEWNKVGGAGRVLYATLPDDWLMSLVAIDSAGQEQLQYLR
jgi:hypothetical protein